MNSDICEGCRCGIKTFEISVMKTGMCVLVGGAFKGPVSCINRSSHHLIEHISSHKLATGKESTQKKNQPHMKSASVVLHDIIVVWISVEYKRQEVPDRENGPNGLTLERRCLLSMYVESFVGVVNINLR